ncbi:biliverdin-producing heme oxygenase [Cognatilysobacter terrigena]|uniref:biliverdin-producing heme oxygenase n=1 Tax=Cognatilysobacter terrigena TaxID=2488749 RepID=UPI00105F960A|nr:biliverdin-producing heme oxygenase [Lysobacter terrigena]
MSPPNSLRWRLRDATADAHARVDARVGDAFDDVAGYAMFLRAMHRFVANARHVLGDADDLVACEAALLEDLSVVGSAPVDSGEAPATTRDDARLGWRYVIAGSSLGARVLVRRVEALGFDATRGARYLTLHAQGDAWRTLLSTLDALRLSPGEERAACAGANEAFACVERCLDNARYGAVA